MTTAATDALAGFFGPDKVAFPMSSTVTAFGTFVDLYAGVAQSDDRVLPEIRYAKKDGVHIAYQVVGEGDLDLLLVSAWFSHLDALGDPRLRALPTAFVLV